MPQHASAPVETVHVITDELFPAYEISAAADGQSRPLQVTEQTADRWRAAIAAYADTCHEISAALAAQSASARKAA